MLMFTILQVNIPFLPLRRGYFNHIRLSVCLFVHVYDLTIHLIDVMFSHKVGSTHGLVLLKNLLDPYWDSKNYGVFFIDISFQTLSQVLLLPKILLVLNE